MDCGVPYSVVRGGRNGNFELVPGFWLLTSRSLSRPYRPKAPRRSMHKVMQKHS